MTRRFLILLPLLLAAAPARAVDGVIEINQTCAPVGCFPGDAARFPITITEGGSYRLTSNLTADMGANAIEITVAGMGPGVTLDLNGFEVIGVAGSLDGIIATAWATRSVTVRNGTVRDFGGDGIDLGVANGAIVEGIHARENGGRGIHAGFAGNVRVSVAYGNGDAGILVNNDGLVESCVAEGNTGAGIYAYGGSVRGSLAYQNSFYGVQAYRSTVSDTSAHGNTLAGFFINEGNLVDSTSVQNTVGGGCIYVGDRSRVAGNTCVGMGSATGSGIVVGGSGNRIEGNNAVSAGTAFDVAGSANLIIRNSASSSTTPYSIAAGNTAGPTVTSATIGASSNPHANYSY